MMPHVITFHTAKFDIKKETPNPINPIAGESVLLWLRERLMAGGYEVDMPDTEDWGWYTRVKKAGAVYLLGATAEADDPGPEIHWIVQIHRQRSLKDKLTGANKMTKEDPLTGAIESILRSDPSITVIEVDRS
jgi:hypothetical protein